TFPGDAQSLPFEDARWNFHLMRLRLHHLPGAAAGGAYAALEFSGPAALRTVRGSPERDRSNRTAQRLFESDHDVTFDVLPAPKILLLGLAEPSASVTAKELFEKIAESSPAELELEIRRLAAAA